MKKIVMVLSFFWLWGTTANSQNDIRFGFQFSPTLSWMKTQDKLVQSNGSPILGAKLGASGEYYFRQNYAISGGIGFAFNHSGRLKHLEGGHIWQKSDLSVDGLDTLNAGAVLKYNLQYVEIPVSLKMISGYFGELRYFAEVPTIYLGFNTQARGSIEGAGNQDTDNEDISPDVNFFNLSWGVGGGVEYEVSQSTSLIAGIFYQQGFTDVSDDNNVDDSKATISAIVFRLGVMF